MITSLTFLDHVTSINLTFKFHVFLIFLPIHCSHLRYSKPELSFINYGTRFFQWKTGKFQKAPFLILHQILPNTTHFFFHQLRFPDRSIVVIYSIPKAKGSAIQRLGPRLDGEWKASLTIPSTSFLQILVRLFCQDGN